MANKQHAQFSDENGNIFYLENETEDVLDPSGKPLSNGGDLSEASVTFTPDATRKLPQSGGRFKAFLGSIVKYLTDLGAAAYLAVANNCTTTQAGSLLDARQGKVLMDKANQLNSELDATKQSFQAGVDTLYNKCSSCGATPSEKTPTAISTAIQTIYNNRYNEGINAGTAGYSFTSRIAGGEQRSTVYFPLQRVSSVTVYGSTINQYPCIEIKIAGELVYSRYSAYDSHSIPNITRSVSGGNVQVDVWGINNQHTAIDLYIATA